MESVKFRERSLARENKNLRCLGRSLPYMKGVFSHFRPTVSAFESTHEVQPTRNAQSKRKHREHHRSDRHDTEEHPGDERQAPRLADKHSTPGNDEQRRECKERNHRLAHFTSDGIPPLKTIVRRNNGSY